MRFRNSTAAAVCVLAAGLALGGCESGGSGGSVANVSSSAQAGSTPSAAASAPGAQAGAAHGVCQPGNLSFALGKASTSGSRSQTTQAVDLTNQGPSASSVDGFPGVDLLGVARGKQNAHAELSWSPFVLLPDQAMHAGTYVSPIVSGS
jgi:hypothetical protein